MLLRKPITGIAFCCARAGGGHATAAPPRSINSRRFTRTPHDKSRDRKTYHIAALKLSTAPRVAAAWFPDV